MSFLYLTADKIGIPTGGGQVTYNEHLALNQLADSLESFEYPVCRDVLEGWAEEPTSKGLLQEGDPWMWDNLAYSYLDYLYADGEIPQLCHIYAGTFSKTVAKLKEKGCKVVYTAAAHDIQVSKEEHEALGCSFAYDHLTIPELWKRYLQGYLDADLIVCPSYYSASIMKSYGCKNVEVIPHGINLPETTVPPLETFIVGYLGAYGPDKGVRYLLQAWKELNYRDSYLALGGRDANSLWVSSLIERFGGGNIWKRGWVDKISDFYDNISVYFQCSSSEGFGIEVLEAQSHARPVFCSQGAGARDHVPAGFNFPARDVNAIKNCIQIAKEQFKRDRLVEWGAIAQEWARGVTWDSIRDQYKQVWKDLLK